MYTYVSFYSMGATYTCAQLNFVLLQILFSLALAERGRSILKKWGKKRQKGVPSSLQFSAQFQVFIPRWQLCLIWCLPGCR